MLESDYILMANEERRRAMMNAFTPKGLLPNKVSFLTKELDPERCYELEKRTALLLSQILPKQYSEQLRNSLVSYLQCLIMNSVPCQVFAFGSVPLKTYLPDGDIDLTVFSFNQDLNDGLVHEVLEVLENERRNKNGEFLVKEICYIEGQVKILKCLVDKFVVDISFNQISGLGALCFFEEVDNLIPHDHLFKCSIILIKAWCFHESRILGASHGLISTYALEVLVLYIFHIYNDIFILSGPLEVLFRFLDFYSKFDWNNYIVSLSGPIPICSLPNMMSEPPRNDCGELLLKREVLNAWKAFYGVTRRSQGPFVSKYLNILDPLCENNNLGRSISKGNFYRLKSAMALGAERLMTLFDCTEEKIKAEFDYFFKNIWDRHGNSYLIHLHNLIVGNNTTSPVNVMNASNLPFLSPPPPPLPGFPPPPPPPGFGHANSSRNYNMPYSGTIIVTSNVQDNQLSSHVKWPMSLTIPSWFSPGSIQRGVDNPRPIFPPTMACVPFNHMNMNAYPTNLNTSIVTNYSSLGATSNPYFVRVLPDILKADFLSHLMNLKHGRLCENPQLQWHFPYLPTAIVPPFHYPMEVASMTHSNFMNNMPQLPPPPPPRQFSIMPNQFPHQGFNPSVKNRRACEQKRSGGSGISLIDPKRMSNLITKNEGSSHDSVFDDNSDDTPVIGTNEASSQGECTQSVPNELENVEGDSADPSSNVEGDSADPSSNVEGDSADPSSPRPPTTDSLRPPTTDSPRPPTTDSPRIQDEHVSIFDRIGAKVCIFYECVKGVMQCR